MSARAMNERSTSVSHATISGWALIVGGLMFAIGNLLHPLEHNDPAYHAATWEAAHLLCLLSLPVLLLGLPALIEALEMRGAGGYAPVAAAMVVAGAIGMAPGLLLEAYVAPQFGHEMMQRIEATGFGAVGGFLSLLWVVSSVPLAVACHRAGFGPSWIHAALVGATLALLAAGGVPGPVGGSLIIAATAVYGTAMAVLGSRLRAV